MNTLNEKLEQLKRALDLCNEMFEEDPSWNDLGDESRLRFAHALMTAFRNADPQK